MDSNLLERIKEEGEELQKKIVKLQDFIKSDKFSQLDITNQILLRRQLRYMQEYRKILYSRILYAKAQSQKNRKINNTNDENEVLKEMKENLMRFIYMYVKEEEEQSLLDTLSKVTTLQKLKNFIKKDFYNGLDDDYKSKSETRERIDCIKLMEMVEILEKINEKEKGNKQNE